MTPMGVIFRSVFTGQPSVAVKPNPAQEKLLGRYVKAWEQLNLDSFVALLKEDATYTMPPLPQWYAGRKAMRHPASLQRGSLRFYFCQQYGAPACWYRQQSTIEITSNSNSYVTIRLSARGWRIS